MAAIATAPMGYNSWYDLMCSPYMNETTLERTADAMIAKGLFALGYVSSGRTSHLDLHD